MLVFSRHYSKNIIRNNLYIINKKQKKFFHINTSESIHLNNSISESSSYPLEILKGTGAHISINDLGRKIKSEELAEKIIDVDCLIAGTEKLTVSS